MRVVIASVPFATPFAPALGGPLVAAEFEAQGVEARVVDGSLLCLESLWSPDCLRRGIEHLRDQLGHLERHDTLSRAAFAGYQEATRAVLGAQQVLAQVGGALATLRGHGTGEIPEPATYDRALGIVQAALGLASAPFWPEQVSLHRYRPPAPLRSVDDLLRHARRPVAESLFGEALNSIVTAAVLEDGGPGPDLVGLSITFPEQLGPAAMLGRCLRERGFRGHIAWGGALMAHLADDLLRATPLLQAGLVDVIVPHPGIQPLLRWLEAGSSTIPVAGALVPGQPWVPGTLDVHEHARWVEAMPTPRFDDLPLDRYLSPRPVLPLLTTLGCYHQRCTFCDHFHSVCRYRPRSVNHVLRDLRVLHERFACRDIYLVDDCTPPRMLRQLAQGLLQWRDDGGPELGWITECRAERALLAEGLLTDLGRAGCRMLLFGLESADDGVLEAMGKGTDSATLSAVLRAVHAAGIGTWCFYMVGYPAEDPVAAQVTQDFLAAHAEVVDVLAGGPFVVTRHAPVALDPGRHGVRLVGERASGSRKAPPPRLDLLLPHQGGRMSEAQQGRVLRALLEDPHLQHYRHPLVVEAHTLFLDRRYYHQHDLRPPSAASSPPSASTDVWRACLVEPVPDLSVQYFRFPTQASRVPSAGKITQAPTAVLFDLARGRSLEVTVPVAALVERCLAAPRTVDEHIHHTVELGQGDDAEVEQAITQLVEAGFLVVQRERSDLTPGTSPGETP
ncbi:MAG: radical SAM protein [Pseudomonadota bacterium]